MTGKSVLVRALRSGDAELGKAMDGCDVDERLFAEEDVQSELRCAAEQVVFHRLNYHEAVKQAIEIGTPCDIWTAARAGVLDHVNRLLSDDPDLLNAVDEYGRTPLQRASLIYGICKQCEEVADFLLAKGATCDVFTASTFCISEVVTRVVKQNPEVVSVQCQGSTPLNWAVRPRRNYQDAPEICKALLDAGANLNDRDENESGMTPLHHAAEWGPPICLQLVDLLLDAGADVNHTDNHNWTPLDYAQDRKRNDMVNHLKSRGAIGKDRG